MYLKKSIFTVLFAAGFVFATEYDSSRISFSGWGYFTFGRVESSPIETGQYDINFEKEWLSDFDAGLKTVARIGKGGKARLHFGLTTGYLLLDYRKDNAEFLRRRFVPYLIDAALEQTFSFGKNTIFTEFGFFPVKYNPQAMNLGEYLFRSGTYPGYLSSGFELADKEKLTGIHGLYKYDFANQSSIQADLYFTNDMRDYPIHDFSLSYILTGKVLRFAEIAAGISHAHLIVLDERKTTPINDTIVFRKGTPYWNNVALVDSSGDTIEYTFRGTKGMARLTLDPKALFKTSVFGEQDLKIYAEAALLGFKNYPYWYDNPAERVPVMFGLNLPTFKLLDVLSVEVEWYGSKYWNTPENVWLHRSPLPYSGSPIANYEELKPREDDDWKWSIYASRKLFNRLKISAQVASDHILRTSYMPPPPSFSKYTEIVPRTKDWYWMTRIMYYF